MGKLKLIIGLVVLPLGLWIAYSDISRPWKKDTHTTAQTLQPVDPVTRPLNQLRRDGKILTFSDYNGHTEDLTGSTLSSGDAANSPIPEIRKQYQDIQDRERFAQEWDNGFFEQNYLVTEILFIVLGWIPLIFIASQMPFSYTFVKTFHLGVFGQPLGSSYTEVPVPKKPSTKQELKQEYLIFAILYLITRFSCLWSFWVGLYKFLGFCIDWTF